MEACDERLIYTVKAGRKYFLVYFIVEANI
jgi:hypothetical protein